MKNYARHYTLFGKGEKKMKKILTEVGLLIIGDEILSGRRRDKHFEYSLEYFGNLGVEVDWVYYLTDLPSSLISHFRMIKNNHHICFSFGGIGATPDDCTRQSMAEAHELELKRHPEAVRLIEGKFGEEAYPNRIKMAELPIGADLIPNAYNDIPGFSIGDIHCLPGFPEMAWSMMDWVVKNCYRLADCSDKTFESFVVPGIHESRLVPVLEALQSEFQEVKLSSLPRFSANGRLQVELGATGPKEMVSVVIGKLKEELKLLGFINFL